MSNRRQILLSFLITLAGVGFLAPRVEVLGVRASLTDLASVLIMTVVVWGPTSYHYLFRNVKAFELYYAVMLFILGWAYALVFSDPASFAIGIRVLIFLCAALSVSLIDDMFLRRTIFLVTGVIVVWYITPAFNALTSLAAGEVSVAKFMWDYDSGRLTAPWEVTGTSSVPLGYLFSFVFLYGFYQFNNRRTFGSFFLAIIGISFCILTASRASILSSVMVMMIFMVYELRKSGLGRKVVALGLGFPVIAAIVMLILEKTLMDDALDSSSNQRLNFYEASISNFFVNPSTLLTGYGVSDSLLEARTGTAFYESLIFNSLAQGGVLLVIPSLGLILQPFFRALSIVKGDQGSLRRNLLSLAVIIFIGNSIGGANYFSIYAFFYYSLLFEFLRRKL